MVCKWVKFMKIKKSVWIYIIGYHLTINVAIKQAINLIFHPINNIIEEYHINNNNLIIWIIVNTIIHIIIIYKMLIKDSLLFLNQLIENKIIITH